MISSKPIYSWVAGIEDQKVTLTLLRYFQNGSNTKIPHILEKYPFG